MTDFSLRRYTEFFENLDPANLSQLNSVMTEDARFIDPFNDVQGVALVEKIFQHMYRSLDNPTFNVTHAAMTDDAEPRGLIRWELSSSLNGKPYNITGMSELTFAADGRVSCHIDHWDAAQQFYERIPVIGWLLRTIRARLAVQ